MPNLDGGTFRSGSHNGPVAEGTFSFGLLLPNTEYEVKIRAKNKYGWSEEEPFFVFKTSRLGKYLKFHVFFLILFDGKIGNSCLLHFTRRNFFPDNIVLYVHTYRVYKHRLTFLYLILLKSGLDFKISALLG